MEKRLATEYLCTIQGPDNNVRTASGWEEERLDEGGEREKSGNNWNSLNNNKKEKKIHYKQGKKKVPKYEGVFTYRVNIYVIKRSLIEGIGLTE